MDRHWGVVKDYDRDDGGTMLPNGVLRVLCPSLGGDKVFRVGPLLHGLYRIPAVGETVAVARSHGNRYCWTAERQASDLPAWMTTDYPNRSGLSNADGSVLVVLDRLRLLLGSADADDPVVLWSKLKPILLALCTGIESAATASTHTHVVTGSADPSTHVVTGSASAATGFVFATTARVNTEADDPASTIILGVLS